MRRAPARPARIGGAAAMRVALRVGDARVVFAVSGGSSVHDDTNATAIADAVAAIE